MDVLHKVSSDSLEKTNVTEELDDFSIARGCKSYSPPSRSRTRIQELLKNVNGETNKRSNWKNRETLLGTLLALLRDLT